MKINHLLTARGVKFPKGILAWLSTDSEPVPEIILMTSQGDHPEQLISSQRLDQLVRDIDPFRREVLELSVCGIPLAEFILAPEKSRRERLANLPQRNLPALLRMLEVALVHLGLENDHESGRVVARLMYETESLIRYINDGDPEAPSEACERVKAKLLAHALLEGKDESESGVAH